jgi:hypothetical protein
VVLIYTDFLTMVALVEKAGSFVLIQVVKPVELHVLVAVIRTKIVFCSASNKFAFWHRLSECPKIEGVGVVAHYFLT